MKLIVGLGNPGNEYNGTRHNIGFMFLDEFCKENGITIKKNKFNGMYEKTVLNNTDVILLKPQSFINLSGDVIKKYVDYYKIELEDILIISDDLDLPIGVYKLKQRGSSGGHNGLKSIENNLNSIDYKRLKIGISNNKEIDSKDYVLGKIPGDDLKIYENLFKTTNQIIKDFITISFDDLMSKYNHK